MAAQALAWKSRALFEEQDSDNPAISTADVLEMRDSVFESLIAVASSTLDFEIRLQVLNACYAMLLVSADFKSNYFQIKLFCTPALQFPQSDGCRPSLMRLFQAAFAIADISQVFGKRQESRQWSDATAKQLRSDQHADAIMKAVEMVVCPIISGQVKIAGAVQHQCYSTVSVLNRKG
jgi:hypothetical protein